jgi:hypothetical protein
MRKGEITIVDQSGPNSDQIYGKWIKFESKLLKFPENIPKFSQRNAQIRRETLNFPENFSKPPRKNSQNLKILPEKCSNSPREMLKFAEKCSNSPISRHPLFTGGVAVAVACGTPTSPAVAVAVAVAV